MPSLQFLKRFCANIRGVKSYKEPPQCVLVTLSHVSHLIGLYGFNGGTYGWKYHLYAFTVLASLFLHALTITLDILDPQVYTSITLLGDDVCIIMGTYLILFESIWYLFYKEEIQQIGLVLTEHFNRLGAYRSHGNAFNLGKQRFYFFQEVMLTIIIHHNGFVLWLAICIEPMFVPSKGLPYRAKLPFDASDGWRHLVLYGFQVFSTFYLLQHIVFVDLYGMCCMNECSLHLSIVSNEFKILDEVPRAANVNRTFLLMESKKRLRQCIQRHQQIIKLTDTMSGVYEIKFFAQFIGSLSIICLTAFEATVTLSDKMACMKFIAYMFAAFMQLFVWCWIGNKIYYQSTALSESVFNCQWYSMDNSFKLMIKYIIMRSQQPIYFRGSSFYKLNFETFISVLSSSYSFFALLQTLRTSQ